MNASDLREKSVEELRQLRAELRDKLFRDRMKHYAGQLDKPSQIRDTRRAIARLETVLSERG
ncbi:MAG: 50S ribosomal protein L29 [Deltaproteobacteria bacterium]|nr:MAG: 50S ribosomal protein L29 [Deltaproteobacteria bacterium]